MKVRDLAAEAWHLHLETEPPIPQTYRRPIKEIPIQWPGHVHRHLLEAGLIPDPQKLRYAEMLGWVEERPWRYTCEFTFTPDAQLPFRELSLDALDGVVEVRLNGKRLAEHSNFFRPLTLDVTDFLVAGSNSLELLFKLQLSVALQRRRDYFLKEQLDPELPLFDERAFLRKPAYMFGWDWGPRIVSCGLAGPIVLQEYLGKISHFSARTEPLAEGFLVHPRCETQGEPVLLTLTYNGEALKTSASGDFESFRVQGELWWPNGEGPQPLQWLQLSGPGFSKTVEIGLRTIELLRQPDAHGTSFEFLVNGRPLWARGANWIPNHSLPSEAGFGDSLQSFKQLGMNMLRVWGGGMYESDALYEQCDRLGLLVWQDFPFACSYYPDDALTREEIQLEASHQIKRLQHHPSLALWCGNNENRSLHFGKWSDKRPDRFHGEVLYDQVLKNLVSDLDPGRAYIESSPLLVAGMDTENPALHSDDHFWDVWHGKGDWTHYRSSQTRFCSEFGFASSCSPEAWRLAGLDPCAASPNDPSVRFHDRTGKPFERFQQLVELHYPRAESLAEWIYYSQLNQRDAMRAAIEHYRTSEVCRGALIWQANDCWPGETWSIQDFSRRLKPAGMELRRLFAPVLLAAWLDSESLRVWLVNDGPADLQTRVVVQAIDWENIEATGHAENMQVAGNIQVPAGGRKLAIELPRAELPKHGIVKLSVNGLPAADRWLLLQEPKNTQLKAQPLRLVREGNTAFLSGNGLFCDLVIHGAELDRGEDLVGDLAWTGYDPHFVLKKVPAEGIVAHSLAGVHPVILDKVLRD